MDILSILGLIVGLGAVILGQYLEGGNFSALLNVPAMVIVMGGTIGAVMLQSPAANFGRAMRMIKWAFAPPKLYRKEAIAKIVNWSHIARKEGLLGLENLEQEERDPFSRKGLQLLVDGSEPESIRAILNVDNYTKEQSDNQAAGVFESMGGYSPTIGIIAAVMGLIHVMGNLADPSRLGSGIAVAFVATIYGVGAANLIFLPVAGKLKTVVYEQVQYREMIVEGIVSIAEGENPRNIETKLQGYLQN